MVDKLDSDKRRALAYPDSHREYTAEWNYFYKKRYVERTFGDASFYEAEPFQLITNGCSVWKMLKIDLTILAKIA